MWDKGRERQRHREGRKMFFNRCVVWSWFCLQISTSVLWYNPPGRHSCTDTWRGSFQGAARNGVGSLVIIDQEGLKHNSSLVSGANLDQISIKSVNVHYHPLQSSFVFIQPTLKKQFRILYILTFGLILSDLVKRLFVCCNPPQSFKHESMVKVGQRSSLCVKLPFKDQLKLI